MNRGDTAGIIVGCIIATIGVMGMAMSGGPSASPAREPAVVYRLSVSVSPAGAGWVTPSSGQYERGALVTLRASPASGYTFDRWSGSASDTSPSIVITMHSDRSVTANFKPTPRTSKVLFSDDFSDETGGWDTYSAEYGSVFYKDGWLHLTNKNPSEFLTGTWAHKHFADFILEVETKLVAGTDSNWHIVICRYQDGSNYYRFAVSADGHYFVSKLVNGDVIGLASVVYSSYINQGVGAVNLIRIECVGSNLSLSANGHPLWKGTDAAFAGGDIVLAAHAYADTSTEISFDNITVTEP